MKYIVNQIKLGLEQEKTDIEEKIKKILSKTGTNMTSWKISKESIDARDKKNIVLVYSAEIETDRAIPHRMLSKLNISEGERKKYQLPNREYINFLQKRPITIGFGPCGMFAALILAEAGLKPVVYERGEAIEDRIATVNRFWSKGILNPESNVQFGEGGAGTFSDGKLTTGIKDIRIQKVLEEFVSAGAEEEILYKQKPHIGTDVLRNVVINIRKKIIDLGGEINFNSKLTDIFFEETKEGDRRLTAIEINGAERIEAENLILAPGHSARDTFRMLYKKNMSIEQKPFSIGVRIEHEQQHIDRAQYGRSIKKLGAAEYKLSYRCNNGRGVYTFCMCPGGHVIVASSQEGGVVTNGMSYHSRKARFASSALLVDVRTSDFDSEHPLAGVEFQEKYEKIAFEQGGRNYEAPKATWGEFVKNTESGCKIRASLPDFAVEAMLEAMPHLGRKLSGFDAEEAILTAVESRSSSPVRILRDNDFESLNIKGIYPAGEGAGYAGGITSAATDGIRIAEKVALIGRKEN